MDSSLFRVRQALERGRAVFFVGSGLSSSTSLRYPSWRKLVRDLYVYCTGTKHVPFKDDERADVLKFINSDRLIDAAELLIAKLKRESAQHLVASYLRDTFSRISQQSVADPVYDQLVRLRNVAYVTTNYDSEIAGHWTSAHRQSIAEFTWNSTNLFESAARHEFIMYAHGRAIATQSEEIVLARSDFDRIVSNTPFQHWLRWLFTARTVIFAGYSVSDPDIQSVLEFVRANTPGGEQRPYWLAAQDDAGSALSREVVTARFGLEFLLYEKIDDQHRGLQTCLLDLFESVEVIQRRKADSSYIVARLASPDARNALRDLFARAFPSALEGVIFYGSGMRSSSPPHDIDVLLVTTDDASADVQQWLRFPTGNMRLVVAECERLFGVALHLEALSVADFFIRYTAGDPLVASIVIDGFDLLDREPFHSCRAIALANPVLSRDRLVRFLRFQRNTRLIRDIAYEDHQSLHGWASLSGLVLSTLQCALAISGAEEWRLSDSARLARIPYLLSESARLYAGHSFLKEAEAIEARYRQRDDRPLPEIPRDAYGSLWDALASFDNDYIESRLPSRPVNLPLPSFSPGFQKANPGSENALEYRQSMKERTLLDESAPVIGTARRHAMNLGRAFEKDIYNMVSVRALRNPEDPDNPFDDEPELGDPIMEEILRAGSLPMSELIACLRLARRI